jgi:hypothetical protein
MAKSLDHLLSINDTSVPIFTFFRTRAGQIFFIPGIEPFAIMDASEIAVGMCVRYPRTGTTGKVESLETIEDQIFATLDSTHLLYRVDQLVPAGTVEEKKKAMHEDVRKIIEEERELASTMHEVGRSDEMCDGGG